MSTFTPGQAGTSHTRSAGTPPAGGVLRGRAGLPRRLLGMATAGARRRRNVPRPATNAEMLGRHFLCRGGAQVRAARRYRGTARLTRLPHGLFAGTASAGGPTAPSGGCGGGWKTGR